MKPLFKFLFLLLAASGCTWTGFQEVSKPANFIEVSVADSVFHSRSSRGVAVADFDLDGDDDIYVTNLDSAEGNKLLLNDGAFKFRDISTDAGVKWVGSSKLAVWFDANNDGHLDLLVGGPGHNAFFLNNGHASFTNQKNGLELGRDASAFAVADFNHDGWLDVYACNFMNENNLFINVGNGVFEDRNWNSGAQIGHLLSMGAVALDVDNDRDQDIYCIYDAHQPNRMFKNEGNGLFDESGARMRMNYRGQGMSTDFADFDHDGKFDFYVTNLNDNALFMQKDNGVFEEVAARTGTNDKGMGWGVVCLDYDNDTWADIYVVNQFHYTPLPNLLYRNIEGKKFINVAKDQPLESRKDGFGGAAADFNADGKLDLVVANASAGGIQLFGNKENNQNRFVQLNLVGEKSNRYGVGARIEIQTSNAILIDEITTGSGYASQNSYTLHTGVGADSLIQEIRVFWPGGTKQIFTNVKSNARYIIDEVLGIEPFNQNRYAQLVRKSVTIEPAPSWFAHLKPDTTTNVARFWNEILLECIRNDFARPTVHARNLYHVSACMYDVWAYYHQQNLVLPNNLAQSTKRPSIDDKSIETAISYAAFRMISHRFRNSPGARYSIGRMEALFKGRGFDPSFTNASLRSGNPAAIGNYFAQQWISYGLQDGANEVHDYKNEFYKPVNDPFAPTNPGNAPCAQPNRWQPLVFSLFIDQSGNVIPGNVPSFQNAEWGNVKPFALRESDRKLLRRDGQVFPVYFDPGPPPRLDSSDANATALYQWGFSLVPEWATHHDMEQSELIDISPASLGNIQSYPRNVDEMKQYYTWGACLGKGYKKNPRTGLPYEAHTVKRGDFTRVLAEFWADGPKSETPPGHWFTILNHVTDHPDFVRRWNGQGEALSETEWYLKSYLTLGGAMHDAAITAWGIKGYYDYVRPISAIRYMASLGQSSDKRLPNYHPWGIPLKNGYVEIVKEGDELAGENNEHAGKIKLFTWRGPSYVKDPETQIAGVGWILAENWWPYQRPTFITPPFSGYISGHSTYSSAAAEVLTQITGDPFFPGGLGKFSFGKNAFLVFEQGPSTDVVLQWARYKDAADQSALSRIWGGIHPPQDDLPGRRIGTEIGRRACAHANQIFRSLPPM